MKPMKEWGPAPIMKNPWWGRTSPTHFAFTSNNMYDIEGHINCVDTLEDFKKQLPSNATVLSEEKVTDYRGTRFIIVGKMEGTPDPIMSWEEAKREKKNI